MRKIEYLSPTSIAQFRKNKDEFYAIYLADNKPMRFPQTGPMAVGSAFDAFAKNYLVQEVLKIQDPRFDRVALFEKQVEIQNRDQAWRAGEHCFKEYMSSGAMADLILDLNNGLGQPRFEIEVRGSVDLPKKKEIPQLTLLGRPDVFYINKHAARVVLDWKVNGYYSASGASPATNYVRLRGPNNANFGAHKDAMPMMKNGMYVDCAGYLEHKNEEWAAQLSIYAWLCGVEPGDEFVAAIHQLVWRAGEMRVAEHASMVSQAFQRKVLAWANEIWERCHSGHFFTEMSLEESKARCEALDKLHVKTDNTNQQWLQNALRNQGW